MGNTTCMELCTIYRGGTEAKQTAKLALCRDNNLQSLRFAETIILDYEVIEVSRNNELWKPAKLALCRDNNIAEPDVVSFICFHAYEFIIILLMLEFDNDCYCESIQMWILWCLCECMSNGSTRTGRNMD